MSKWYMKSNTADLRLMSRTLQVSEVTAYVLATRGLRTKREALSFLYPSVKDLHDESKLRDADKAAALIAESIRNGISAAVFGDYDVDGVTSTYMLHKSLTRLGANVRTYLPRRIEDGYGLNPTIVRRIRGEGAGLLICCDNGVSAFEEIELALSLGMKVIVIDHHEIQTDAEGRELLPAASAVIDPKRTDCGYPAKNLCAAALCYKFLRYLHREMCVTLDSEDEYLALSAFASVTDIVEMTGETRTIVKTGMEIMSEKPVNLGLSTLIRQKELEGKPLGVFDLGFILGPCMNAAGRLDSAELALSLLQAKDRRAAENLAARLSELNDRRKAMTAECAARAMEAIGHGEMDNVIVYYDEEIHESLAGIVAGKIKETLYRPAVVLTGGAADGQVKGSARSIEGYNIFQAISGCKDLLDKFGGHGMAAGLSLTRENIPELRRRLNEDCKLCADDFQPVFRLEKELKLNELTFALASELRLLAPFGAGCEEPLFAARNVVPETCELIGESRRTIRMSFQVPGERRLLKAICFGMVDKFVSLMEQRFKPTVAENFLAGTIREVRMALDIIYMVELNHYNGKDYLQIRIVDFRPAKQEPQEE